jgi:Domain of unknown function (DUF4145)
MAEKRFTSAQKCGHCGNVAPMEVVKGYSQTQTDEDSVGAPWEHGKIFELLLCPACYGVILRTYWWHDGMESEQDISPEVLYPSEMRLPPGLPPAVQKAFLSAQRVKSIDSNAFGVLIGRVVEEVCADRKADGKTLADKLKDLADRTEIPTKLVGVADGLRKLRNLGAHAELGELTSQEVPVVEDLCRALLDYLYVAPFLTQRAIDRLSALRTNSSGDSLSEPSAN